MRDFNVCSSAAGRTCGLKHVFGGGAAAGSEGIDGRLQEVVWTKSERRTRPAYLAGRQFTTRSLRVLLFASTKRQSTTDAQLVSAVYKSCGQLSGDGVFVEVNVECGRREAHDSNWSCASAVVRDSRLKDRCEYITHLWLNAIRTSSAPHR